MQNTVCCTCFSKYVIITFLCFLTQNILFNISEPVASAANIGTSNGVQFAFLFSVVLAVVNCMGYTFNGYDLLHVQSWSQVINLFRLNSILVFLYLLQQTVVILMCGNIDILFCVAKTSLVPQKLLLKQIFYQDPNNIKSATTLSRLS